MIWNYTFKENVSSSIVCLHDYSDECVIHLSANNRMFSAEDQESGLLRFVLKHFDHTPTTEELQNVLLSLQKEYDTCDEVNVFYINNNKYWFDKTTRLSLNHSINLQKESGNEETTIWFDNTPITLSIDKALSLLTKLESYASECYNVTQKHIAKIKSTETIEELIQFDITSDYPYPLNFVIEENEITE